MKNFLTVNNIEYEIIKLLGKGKGGYSYLVTKNNSPYVIKQIHHEPCSYYTFDNKLETEKNDYSKLLKTKIRIPKLLDIDEKEERILKDFIDGPTIYELVLKDKMKNIYFQQIKDMADSVYKYDLNIDYFPTNFIVKDNLIWYIDFECNSYMDEWNLENWGIKYWSKTKDFLNYVNFH